MAWRATGAKGMGRHRLKRYHRIIADLATPIGEATRASSRLFDVQPPRVRHGPAHSPPAAPSEPVYEYEYEPDDDDDIVDSEPVVRASARQKIIAKREGNCKSKYAIRWFCVYFRTSTDLPRSLISGQPRRPYPPPAAVDGSQVADSGMPGRKPPIWSD